MKATFAEIIKGRRYSSLTPEQRKDEYWHPQANDRLRLADGTSLSVQVSETHYCSPRNNWGPYYEVEVGFPMTAEGEASILPIVKYEPKEGDTQETIDEQNKALREVFWQSVQDAVMDKMPDGWYHYDDAYEGDEYSPPRKATVWAYVPVEMVQAFIDEHGGERQDGNEVGDAE